MNEQQHDEYSAIESVPDSVTFYGQDYTVVPLKVGQLPKFARALKGIDLTGLQDMAEGNVAGVFNLIANHGEQVIEAISVATGIGREVIEQGDADELVLLAAKVVRVNADFFRLRLMPAVRSAMGQAKAGDGQTAFNP